MNNTEYFKYDIFYLENATTNLDKKNLVLGSKNKIN